MSRVGMIPSALVGSLLLLSLSACGQRGPLVLPSKAAPAATAAATASPPTPAASGQR